VSSFWRSVCDFALLQIGWFACVLGAAAGDTWTGPLVAVGLIAVHCGLVTAAGARRRELRNVAVWGLAGCVIDAVQVRLGVLCFPPGTLTLAGIPPWLAALWFLFPILFHSSFAWLHGRPLVAALLALVGAPLSYRAGVALGALDLGRDEWASLLCLGLAWALYLPVALPRRRA
jgi:hypothetical protein